MIVYIRNVGCDDETEFLMEVNKEELETLQKLVNTNNAMRHSKCQPKIFINKVEDITLHDELSIQYGIEHSTNIGYSRQQSRLLGLCKGLNEGEFERR